MAIPVYQPAPKKDNTSQILGLVGMGVGAAYGGAGGAAAGAQVGSTVGDMASNKGDPYNPVSGRLASVEQDPVTQLKSGQAAAKNLGLENEYSDTLQQALARARKNQTNPPPTGVA